MLSVQTLQRSYACSWQLANKWLPYIDLASRWCGVRHDAHRLACFLAQIGHESGRLRYTKELWGPTRQQGRYELGSSLAKQLGNTLPGDGRRFLGRGLIQITGRLNYHLTTRRMRLALQVRDDDLAREVPDFEKHPFALEQPLWAAMSAGLYWIQNKLNVYADAHDFMALTRRINGGINGLADRQALYVCALSSCIQGES